MSQLLDLARDHGRIDMLDLATDARRVILTGTGPNPDGERTSTNERGEATYADADGGVHAVEVSGGNPRAVVAPGATITAQQLALDAHGNLYGGNREGMSLATARTDVERLWDNLPAPIDLELFDGHLLRTDRGTDDLPGGNSLSCVATSSVGQKGEASYVLADGFSEAIDVTVDAPQCTAYVADLSGKAWPVPNLGQEEAGKHLSTDLGFVVTGVNHVKAKS